MLVLSAVVPTDTQVIDDARAAATATAASGTSTSTHETKPVAALMSEVIVVRANSVAANEIPVLRGALRTLAAQIGAAAKEMLVVSTLAAVLVHVMLEANAAAAP